MKEPRPKGLGFIFFNEIRQRRVKSTCVDEIAKR